MHILQRTLIILEGRSCTRNQAGLSRPSLVSIQKTFIRLHPPYGDIIYGDNCYDFSYEKMKAIWYNTELAVTGVIRGI